MPEHPRPDDELLSSHLDGELTAEERTRLEERLATEPVLRDRLAALSAARDLTAAPVVGLPTLDADRMIAAALAASATAPNVTDLSSATTRRTWTARLAVAAAVVVAVALTVPALRAIDGGDDADTAGVATDTSDSFDGDMAGDATDDTAADMATEMAPFADDGGGDGASDDTESATAADDPDVADTDAASPDAPGDAALFVPSDGFDPLPDDLGEFASTLALSAAVSEDWTAARNDLPSTTTAPSPPPDEGEAQTSPADLSARFDGLAIVPCAEIVDVVIAYFAGEPVIAADYAAATVAGAPATVGLFLRADGTAELLLIDQATCEPRSVLLE